MFRNDLNPWNRWPNVLILRLYFHKENERARQKISKNSNRMSIMNVWYAFTNFHFVSKIVFLCLLRGQRKKLDEFWVAKRHLFPLSLWLHTHKHFIRHFKIVDARQLLFQNHSIHYVQVAWHQATKKEWIKKDWRMNPTNDDLKAKKRIYFQNTKCSITLELSRLWFCIISIWSNFQFVFIRMCDKR